MNKQFLKYRDFLSLNESKATAKRRFLDNGKIDQKTFNQIASIDPSSSFKYVEKLIEYYLEGTKIETLKKEIKIFNELSSRNLLKNKDIQQLNYQEFKQEISTGKTKSNSRKEQKQKEAGVQVLLDNEFFKVVVPDTEEASCKYGQGTKWCTSAKENNQFKNYRYKKDVTLYYIEDKSKSSRDPLYKIAVAVYQGGLKQTFNAKDNEIDFVDLPKELFKYFPKEEFKPRDLFIQIDVFERYELDRSKITKNEDGSIDYDGDVNLSARKLTKIPFNFRRVSGSFWCEHNELTSLEGAPKSVKGGFYCYRNNLTSLEGAPESIGRGFYCYYNQLTSLNGAPKSVGGNFDCSHNQLTSLEGAPKSVGGKFDCSHNPDLKSLGGIGEVKGKIYSDIK